LLTHLALTPLDLLQGSGGGVDVRRPGPGDKPVLSAEDVRGEIAVIFVVAVEELP
jgi:hypothetical protein